MSGITEAKARYYASERPGDLLDRANPLLGLANARTTGDGRPSAETAVVEWGYARCYSGLRPVNFTTLPHFSVSSAIS